MEIPDNHPGMMISSWGWILQSFVLTSCLKSTRQVRLDLQVITWAPIPLKCAFPVDGPICYKPWLKHPHKEFSQPGHLGWVCICFQVQQPQDTKPQKINSLGLKWEICWNGISQDQCFGFTSWLIFGTKMANSHFMLLKASNKILRVRKNLGFSFGHPEGEASQKLACWSLINLSARGKAGQ